MKKLYLLIKCKNILFTATMCLFSTMLNAQVTTAQIRELIANGECETAQSLYNVYKAQESKTDHELEMQIKDCLANKSTEGKSNWREEEVRSEIVIGTMSRKYSLIKYGKDMDPPSEKEWYNKIISDVKKVYPNRMIGINESNHSEIGIYKGWWQNGVLQDNYTEYNYHCELEILEPNIRYYLNEAIRNAKDGSRIVINQLIAFGDADENLENQLMGILMEEGFRVVSNISDADYYINLKMSDDFLQIQLVNSHTGEYEGVASVKFEGFLEEKEKKEEGDVYSRSLHFKGVVSPPH